MYYLILAFTGCITALMVAANGSLARAVGAAPALVLIHLSGLGATAGALALVRPSGAWAPRSPARPGT